MLMSISHVATSLNYMSSLPTTLETAGIAYAARSLEPSYTSLASSVSHQGSTGQHKQLVEQNYLRICLRDSTR